MFWYVSNILDDLIVLSFNETNARNWLNAQNSRNEIFAGMEFHWINFKGFLHNCFSSAHIHITCHHMHED